MSGTFLVTREAIGALRATGNGPAVVNFSSTSAHFAHPYMAAYAASKGGVLSMTHALGNRSSPKPASGFDCVQPGSISSGMTDGTGSARQSIGPGLPEDADYSLFGKVAPMLPLADGAIFARPDCGGRRRGDVGQRRRLFHHRHRGSDGRRIAHVAAREIERRRWTKGEFMRIAQLLGVLRCW